MRLFASVADYIDGGCAAIIAWSPVLAGIDFAQYVFCHDLIHLLISRMVESGFF
jgi:hypothetical protein